ncbi:MAG: two-component regulator propeller domain-containing protein, partial [Ferruginibacter sp.]
MQCCVFYKWFFYFCSGIIFLLQTAKAQYAEKDFVHYTVKDGLSDNFITGMQQDDQGYLWIGTDVGLNRFDGNSFKNFYQGSAGIPLQSSTVSRLKVFKPGHLGILTRGGFQLLDTRKFSLQNFYIADSTSFSSQRNACWDAMQLPDGSFAVTSAAGFQVYDRSGKVVFLYDAYSVKDIGKKRILYGRDIFKLNDKEYLVYVEEAGLAYYNHEKKIFRQIDPSDKTWSNFSHPVITSGVSWAVKYQLTKDQFIFIPSGKDSILFYDHHLKKRTVSGLPYKLSLEISWESKIRMLNDSVFLINGGRYGFYLFHLNRQTGRVTTDGKQLMPDFKIASVFLDKDKRLWLGTSAGLLKQKLNRPLISSYRYPNPPGQTGNLVTTYSHKNKLYAGRFSWTNGGLSVINPASMQIEKHIQFYGGNNRWNEILSIQMYHPDTLWLGTSQGPLWLDTKTYSYGKLFKEKDSLWVSVLAPVNSDGYA